MSETDVQTPLGRVRRGRLDDWLRAHADEFRSLDASGKSLAEIGAHFGKTDAAICGYFGRLRRLGVALPHLRRGRRLRTDVRAPEMAERIRMCREAGVQGKDIAQELGVSYTTYQGWATLLRKMGALNPIKRGRRPDPSRYALDTPRVQTVVRMTQEGATLQQIGRALGCTFQRVRQIRGRIEALHGPIVCQYLTAAVVARRLKIGYVLIYRLLRLAAVPASGEGRRRFRIGQDAWPRIVETYLRVYLQRCSVCSRYFLSAKWPGSKPRTQRRYCSRACAVAWFRRRNAQGCPGGAYKQWLQPLSVALRRRKRRRVGAWLAFTEAVRRSGLTGMQMAWLSARRLVRRRLGGPIRGTKHHGKRQRLYASADVELAGMIYRTWKARQKGAPAES